MRSLTRHPAVASFGAVLPLPAGQAQSAQKPRPMAVFAYNGPGNVCSDDGLKVSVSAGLKAGTTKQARNIVGACA